MCMYFQNFSLYFQLKKKKPHPLINLWRNFPKKQVIFFVQPNNVSISSASISWLESLISSTIIRHEQGVLPFPFSQCWNMALQQASGSERCFLSMISSSVPLSSKSNKQPRRFQNGASLLMIQIFFPSGVVSDDNWASVGVESVLQQELHH